VPGITKKEWSFISHPLRRLIRFEAYGILFLLAGIFGALITLEPLDYELLVLLAFIAASSAFGFVINDISDMALDARAGNPRNPLADGSLTSRTAQQVSAVFLVLSVICMAVLPVHLLLIELAVIFVFVTYSFFVKAKNIAGLDLVYHALFPALYGLLGYVLYHPLDLTGLVFFVLLAIFGAVGEVCNEIRDLKKDRSERKNTVVLIGELRGFYLLLALMVTAFALIGVFSLSEPGFYWLLVFLPLGFILIQPVWKAMKEPEYRQNFVDVINTRATALAVVMLAVYGIMRFMA
jgi:4-hydroxybenzoate polyprenyltransferase